MDDFLKKYLLQSTGASGFEVQETIQDLWSGYGKINRLLLKEAKQNSVVVKHVRLPVQSKHPRGWNTNLSHARKLQSYKVETAWYANWSELCGVSCRIPKCYGTTEYKDQVLLVLEDLDAAGYSARKTAVSLSEMAVCLRWLANFHASFLQKKPTGLWPIGTYWHLDTRPDELEALTDLSLKKAAHTIDTLLQQSPYQTIVHGDAKLANFCFSEDGERVAAVDFQYTGGGCGMKDVAYFIGSCLHEDDCERYEKQLLDLYFLALQTALEESNSEINFSDLETNWRGLYAIAWTDFYRFLKGWSPEHWKIHSYSERLAREVLETL